MTTDQGREELDTFFRRPEAYGKVYCGVCLAAQLIQHGSGRVPMAAWGTVVAAAFEHPEPLEVRPTGPCSVCRQRLPAIGAPRPGGEQSS